MYCVNLTELVSTPPELEEQVDNTISAATKPTRYKKLQFRLFTFQSLDVCNQPINIFFFGTVVLAADSSLAVD